MRGMGTSDDGEVLGHGGGWSGGGGGLVGLLEGGETLGVGFHCLVGVVMCVG